MKKRYSEMNEEEKQKCRDRVAKYRASEKGKEKHKQYLEQSAEDRATWAKEYYKKNRKYILERTTDYNKLHPEIRQKSNEKKRISGQSKERSKMDRQNLADHYVKTLIDSSGGEESISEKKRSIAEYRINKLLVAIEIIEDKRTCKLCGNEKSIFQFRTRYNRSNNVCLKCEALRSKENTNKKRQTEEGRKKHAQWAKDYYYRNKEKCLERAKIYRDSKRAKEARINYREENKERLYQQEKVAKQKYSKKHVNALTDIYIIKQLLAQTELGRAEIEANGDLIELKRVKILIKRLKNNLIKIQKDNEKHSSSSQPSI